VNFAHFILNPTLSLLCQIFSSERRAISKYLSQIMNPQKELRALSAWLAMEYSNGRLYLDIAGVLIAIILILKPEYMSMFSGY
jgi:hypothetical protein